MNFPGPVSAISDEVDMPKSSEARDISAAKDSRESLPSVQFCE